MRKRTKFKSPVLDFFVVTVCLSVAAYFTYTFWKDLNSTARRTDKTEIAIITFKNRIAQRKFDDRVVWERIDKSTPLYNGDLVRTADLAEAVITFNDGSQVDIYENTMIQVYYSDFAGVQISVGNGNLELESSDNGKVQLTLNDGSTVNAGGGASISAKTTGSTKNSLNASGTGSSGTSGLDSSGNSGKQTIQVKNGSATITGSTGETQAIQAGESISVKSNGEIAKKPVTVTSIPSELKVLNIGEESVPVKLEWSKTRSNDPVILQTSTKKDFSVLSEEKIITSENDSLISLSEGTLYWRVFPKGNEEEASEGKISVESTKALTLVSPSPNAVLEYYNRTAEVIFRWNGNKYAKNYLVNVSSTPDMKNIVASKIVENYYAQIETLGSGQWYWQVTPYYEINSLGYADAGASKVSAFSIEKINGINPPSLTVPLQNASITYKEKDVKEINGNKTLDVIFSWKSEIKANYDLIIAKDADFNQVEAVRHTAGQRINVALDAPETGEVNYYWKVVRNSSDLDDRTPESVVRNFTVSKYINTPAKLLYPPENYITETTKLSSVRFMWKSADNAKSKESIVQVSNSSDFKNLKFEKSVNGTTLENMALPQGEYFWRVATLDEEGNLEYTQPNFLVVQKELTAPVITNIKDDAVIVVAKDSPVKLNWTSVPGADFYNVRIYGSDSKLVAEKPDAAGTSANFTLPDDSYLVKIQAVSSQTEISPLRTGPVGNVSFTVRIPETISPLYPSASTIIEGLNALRTPINFTWKIGRDKPSSSELVIQKRYDDGTMRVVERVKTAKTTASVSRLSPGSYTWQVVASTSEGIPMNSQPVSFTVTPVASLAKPKLEDPKNNFMMDSSFLRKNRSVSFEWNSVPGATEYNFVIYKRNKNGALTVVYSEKGIKTTKVKVKDLSIFDVGDFTWNVTAFSYAKDGFEEQRSETAERSFKIDIKLPTSIETVKTGKMYSE